MDREEIAKQLRDIWSAAKASFISRSEKAREAVKELLANLLRGNYSAQMFTLILVFGILVGAGAKLAASETFTIGYEDYAVSRNKNLYDMNDIQKKLLESGGTLAVTKNASGEMCTE